MRGKFYLSVLLTFILTAYGCGGGGESSGDNHETPTITEKDPNSGTSEEPKPGDGEGPMAKANQPFSFALDLQSASNGYNANLPKLLKSGETYALANANIDVPSTEKTFDESQAPALQVGTLAIGLTGFNLTTVNVTCPAGLAVPQEIQDLAAGTLKTDLEAIWERFYNGCGPTEIRSTLNSLDEWIKGVTDFYAKGQLRCLDTPLYDFRYAAMAGTTVVDTFDVSFSCSDNLGEYWRNYGRKDGYFYLGENKYTAPVVKVKEDGTFMQAFKAVGKPTEPGQSQALLHLQSTKNDHLSRFYMTFTGSGVGWCDGYVASYSDANDANANRVYFKLNKGTSGDCNTASYTEYCLNPGDFSDVGLAQCTDDNGLDLDNAPFTLLTYAALSPEQATEFSRSASALNGHGKTPATLIQSTLADPMLVLKNRIFSSGPGSIPNMIEGLDGAMQNVEGMLEGDPKQCVFNHPTTWTVTSPFNLKQPLALSCDLGEGLWMGYVNDTMNIRRNDNSGFLKAMHFTNDSENRIKAWSIAEGDGGRNTATSWNDSSAGGYLVNYLADPIENILEVSVAGSQGDVFELGCGVQMRKLGKWIYAEGKFAGSDCANVYLDKDCIEEVGDQFFRRSIESCQAVAGATDFEFETIDRNALTPVQLSELMRLRPPEDLKSSQDAATEILAPELPPAEGGKMVETLPLTPNALRFTKVDASMPGLGINCKITSGAQAVNTLDISATYSFALSSLDAQQREALQNALISQGAFIGYNFTLSSSTFKQATLAHKLTSTLKLSSGDGEEIKSLTIDTHTAAGAYLYSKFLTDPLDPSLTLSLHVAGQLQVSCPDTTQQHQGFIRAGLKDVKLRY